MTNHTILRDRVPVTVRLGRALLEERAAACRDPGGCPVHAALARALPGCRIVAVFHAKAMLRRDRSVEGATIALPPEITILQRRLEAWDRRARGVVVPPRDRVLLLDAPEPLAFEVWVPRWALARPALRWAS